MRPFRWMLLAWVIALPSYGASVDKSLAGGKKVLLLITAGEAQKLKKGDSLTLSNKKLGIEASGKVQKVSPKKALVDLDEANTFKAGTKLDFVVSDGNEATASEEKTEDAPTAAPDPAAGGSKAVATVGKSAVPDTVYPYAPNFLALNSLPSDRPTALPFVSPASLFKLKKPNFEGGVRFLHIDSKYSNSGGTTTSDEKTKIEGQDFELMLGFPMPNTKLALGFRFLQNHLDLKVTSFKIKYDVTLYGPILSYQVTSNLAVGFQYDIETFSIKANGIGGKNEATVNVFRPGVTYFKPNLEIELLYSPPINVSDESKSASEPGSVIVNGRFGPKARIIAVQIRRINFSPLDKDYKDIFAVRGGMESARGNITNYGAYFNYKQAAFANDEAASTVTLQRFGLEGFFQREFGAEGRGGLHFGYDIAPEIKFSSTSAGKEITEKYWLSGYYFALEGATSF